MADWVSPRWCVAAGIVALFAFATLTGADRSSAAMAAAATKFLGSLTPEQRKQASFDFSSDERLHWHFIPTETFPRKGLTIKTMNESQRGLAHDLIKAGLSQRGYLTATSIMDLETVLGALEAAQRAARARSGALLLLGFRHAIHQGHLGLARRRPSRVAALHGRQRHAGRRRADVLRIESCGSPRGAEERASHS